MHGLIWQGVILNFFNIQLLICISRKSRRLRFLLSEFFFPSSSYLNIHSYSSNRDKLVSVPPSSCLASLVQQILFSTPVSDPVSFIQCKTEPSRKTAGFLDKREPLTNQGCPNVLYFRSERYILFKKCRVSQSPVLKTEINGRGDPLRWSRDTLYPQKSWY
jgi:hypothetical protein